MIAAPIALVAILQTIWIVDAANGPGTSFTSLPPAIAAAANGDTVIVRAGTYAPFNVSGKALTIRGAGSGTTFVTASSSAVQTVIASVPAGLTFYVSGIAFAPVPNAVPATNDAAIRVSGSGEVVISDCTVEGFGAFLAIANGNPALVVDGGAVVQATRSSFVGGGAYSQSGGTGAVVGFGAALAADASTFVGGIGGSGFSPSGGAGVLVQGGFASLSRSSAFGGGDPFGFAGTGVRITSGGFARIAGFCAIAAGTPGAVPYSVFADASSSAVVHAGAALADPTSGAVTTGAVLIPYVSIAGTPAGGGELQATSPATVTFQGAIPMAPFLCGVDLNPSFSTAGRCAALHPDRRAGLGGRQDPHVELPRPGLQALRESRSWTADPLESQ
jgi:hypothetical protein